MAHLPPNDPVVETLQKQIADLRRELRLLQEKPQPDDVPGQRRTEILFSYHGVVPNNFPSGPYLLKDYTATIHRVDVTAQNPSTTDATFTVLVDGVSAYDGILPAYEKVITVQDLAIEVEEYSTLAVTWTGAADLTSVVLAFQIIAVEGEEFDG